MSRRPRPRLLIVLGMILVAMGIAALLSERGGRPGSAAVSGSAPTAVTRVQRRNLVATDTESGTLSYADPQTVYVQRSGTITWIPTVGKVIRPGHALLMIDNRPVLLLSGSTPAFRDLNSSDTAGPDIYELNHNLVALGYEPQWITVDDVWQPGTTAAVKQLQEHLGEPQTGSLALGQVVFLPGPQLIESQALAAGSTTDGQGSTPMLSTSSTRLVVTVDLGASSQAEATIGEHVTVEMPNGSTAGGRITAVSPVAQSSSSGAGGAGGGGGPSTVPVTIVLDRPARGGGLDQASVSVQFVQSKARDVLSVPVTALLATSGSSFAVQQATAPHHLIPVRTGLFAAGHVAISGAGIHPGLKVTDSQG